MTHTHTHSERETHTHALGQTYGRPRQVRTLSKFLKTHSRLCCALITTHSEATLGRGKGCAEGNPAGPPRRSCEFSACGVEGTSKARATHKKPFKNAFSACPSRHWRPDPGGAIAQSRCHSAPVWPGLQLQLAMPQVRLMRPETEQRERGEES